MGHLPDDGCWLGTSTLHHMGLSIGLLECSQTWQLVSFQASDLRKNKEEVTCLSCHLTLFSGGPGTQNMKTRK